MNNRNKLNIVKIPEKYKKILIVNTSKSEYSFGNAERELMKLYLKSKDFTGVKNITLDTLINFKIINKVKKFLDSNSSILKSETMRKVLLTIGGSMVLYYFYIVGYIFLYGYSFYGEVEKKPIFKILLEQIPFNFKLNVAVGGELLLMMAIISIPLVNIFIKRKDILINWIVFFIESSALTFAMIYLLYVNSKPVSLYGVVTITLVIGFLPLFLFTHIYAAEMFSKKTWRNIGIFVILLLIAVFIFCKGTIEVNIISIYTTYIIVLLSSAVVNFIFNHFISKNKKDDKVKKFQGNKEQASIIIPIVSMMVSGIFSIVCIVTTMVCNIGEMTGAAKTNQEVNFIRFKDMDDSIKEVKGEIITKEDDTYYISLSGNEDEKSNGRLFIIKCDNIISIAEENKKLVEDYEG